MAISFRDETEDEEPCTEGNEENEDEKPFVTFVIFCKNCEYTKPQSMPYRERPFPGWTAEGGLCHS
jgi:hypothetical protein